MVGTKALEVSFLALDLCCKVDGVKVGTVKDTPDAFAPAGN